MGGFYLENIDMTLQVDSAYMDNKTALIFEEYGLTMGKGQIKQFDNGVLDFIISSLVLSLS